MAGEPDVRSPPGREYPYRTDDRARSACVAGCDGRSQANSNATASDPKKSRRAHCRRRAGSGIHTCSRLAIQLMSRIGTRNHTYHGVPSRTSRCLKPATTEMPSTADANKPAEVTLCPRRARQDHETAEIRFTGESHHVRVGRDGRNGRRRAADPRPRVIRGRAVWVVPRRSNRRHRWSARRLRQTADLPRNSTTSTHHRADRAPA